MSSITYSERIKIETFCETKLSDELKQKILNHLRLSWSPGMIAHEFKRVYTFWC
ncbi:hypothetical protein FAM6012_02994 [Lacticaseibacillus paracasei]|uniref:Transposase n=1 Tax=Lacticaseibacillus paracasei TaxID=1597 RepID=A0A8B3GR64_LACPA|nr:hypothetical protein FAM6012_02994 [Lacticaseibacillus paracasei]